MKLLMAVIQNEDEEALVQDLQDHDIGATRIGSSGGFLRASNVTLLIDPFSAPMLDVILGLGFFQPHAVLKAGAAAA